MRIIRLKDLSPRQVDQLCGRNHPADPQIGERVASIFEEVRRNGDSALRKFALLFDKVRLKKLAVPEEEIRRLASGVSPSEKTAIRKAAENIRRFHKSQIAIEKKVVTAPGVVCWREARPIERVGLYVPGGTAVLPSTFLMLAIPAQIAGCREIVVCSPLAKNGKLNPFVAFCAHLLGIERIFLAGGAQAIAAMAYGTRTIPRVDKIFGPGNRYVTQAKTRAAFLGACAIDFPAGPSEVMVISDGSASPQIVAADLLSAADHGSDSQVVLVSPSRSFIAAVLERLNEAMKGIARSEIIRKSLSGSFALEVKSLKEGVEFSNRYAPEHLILSCKNYRRFVPEIRNAGSVFLGYYAPESAGDYASGTNHTLPTSGFAKAYSGLSVESFIKKVSFQEISPEGIRGLGKTIQTLANLEGLPGHKLAVVERLKALKKP